MIVIVEAVVIFIQRNSLKNQKEQVADYNTDLIDLRYGDSFNEILVVDIKGKETILEYGENNVLFYLSASCTSCSDVLQFAERLQEILGKDKVSILFLWSDFIPVSLVEEYGITLENCYSVDDKMILNTPTPTGYILDNQGNIVYYNSDIKMVIEKLYAQTTDMYHNEEQLRLNANQYLMDVYEISNFQKQQVIYFCMSGCPDCEEANAILSNDKEKEKRNIYYLYNYDDIDSAHFKDDYALFRLVYGIKWYPSFLILEPEERYRIVGEVPVETLINALEGQE